MANQIKIYIVPAKVSMSIADGMNLVKAIKNQNIFSFLLYGRKI